MKGTYYLFDDKLFRKYSKGFYKHQTEWKIKKGIAVFCFILAAVIPFVPAICYGVDDFTGFLAILAAGFIFGLIILSAGAIIRNAAMHKLGKPYECMENMFLFSNYSGIQFGYHDRYDQKNGNSAIVHQIAYSNINSVDVNEQKHLVTIYGGIERVEYDNIMTNRITNSFTDGELGNRGSSDNCVFLNNVLIWRTRKISFF